MDNRGTARFSDHTDPNMHTLLEYMEKADAPWVARAAGLTYENFAGKQATVREVREWIWLVSPYVWRKPIFAALLADGRMKHLRANRRGGGYSDDEMLAFAPSSAPPA